MKPIYYKGVLVSAYVGQFLQWYPQENDRRATLAEYGQLGGLKYLLADIEFRSYLRTATPLVDARRANSDFENGVIQGRREMALELIELAAPGRAAKIEEIISKPSTKEKTDE